MTAFVLKDDGYYYAPPIDPQEELDYTLDITDVLGADNISTVAWASAPAGITIVTAKNTNTAKTATVWLKDGTIGMIFLITASFVTTGGRKIDRSFRIQCMGL